MSRGIGAAAFGIALALSAAACVKKSPLAPTPVGDPVVTGEDSQRARAQDDASGGQPGSGQQDPPPKP
jgi:hypothetical protein